MKKLDFYLKSFHGAQKYFCLEKSA